MLLELLDELLCQAQLLTAQPLFLWYERRQILLFMGELPFKILRMAGNSLCVLAKCFSTGGVA